MLWQASFTSPGGEHFVLQRPPARSFLTASNAGPCQARPKKRTGGQPAPTPQSLPGSSAAGDDLEPVHVRPTGGAGRRGPYRVRAGVQLRGQVGDLPRVPATGAAEVHRHRRSAVHADGHRPVSGRAVGVPDTESGAARLGGIDVDRPLDVTALHIGVIDEAGAGEPGVVAEDRRLAKRGALRLVGRARRRLDDAATVGPVRTQEQLVDAQLLVVVPRLRTRPRAGDDEPDVPGGDAAQVDHLYPAFARQGTRLHRAPGRAVAACLDLVGLDPGRVLHPAEAGCPLADADALADRELLG